MYTPIILITDSFANLALDFNIHTRIVSEITSCYDGDALVFVADPECSCIYVELDDNPDIESIETFTKLQSINISTISNTLAEIKFLTDNKNTFITETDKFFIYVELLNKYRCKKAIKELKDKSQKLTTLNELMVLAHLRGIL